MARFSGSRLLTLLRSKEDARILYSYPGASAAFSLRALTVGDPTVVRVRRSSDNAEANFTAREVNDGTLIAWVGTTASDDGHVVTWFDQSGNGNDATQSTAANQPLIVDGGVLVTENGNAALDLDGVDDHLITPDYIVELSQNDATVLAVIQANDASYLLTEADVESPYSSNFIMGGPNGGIVLWVNTTEFGSQPSTSQTLIGFTYDGSVFQAYENGVASGTSGGATVNTEVLNQTVIGSRADGTDSFYPGKIQELITYKSDQSANRVAIENLINSYYEIYP